MKDGLARKVARVLADEDEYWLDNQVTDGNDFSGAGDDSGSSEDDRIPDNPGDGGDGEQYYGGLSSNDLGEGREFTYATELKNSHNPKVFENAYNIEKYFEIN